jgi:CubicO group peptidase (beta-lactamase class C family)
MGAHATRAFAAGLLLFGAAALAACSGQAPTPEVAAPEDVSRAGLAKDLGLPVSSPEALGFDPAGLDALRTEFRGLVDQNKLAGVTTLLARGGKIVHFDTYGYADAGAGAALSPDSIFRIASMTKPVAGVAMMQLYEEGKWALEDPVSKHIPEFKGLRVRTASGALEEQRAEMTMAQLMSHSAGFDVSAGYADAGLQSGSLQDMIDTLAELPLASQPGAAWDYGPSVNIQGYLIEKLSGQPLDAYLDERIFKPLGMKDTGFWVDDAKAGRVVAVHTYDENGSIIPLPENRVATQRPVFLSASGGLMSTASDYWRFAQAVANGGELAGARILRPETVTLMRTNVLAPGAKVDLYGPSQEGVGFGMDFAIIMDPALAGTPQGKNTFYWGGAFGTWFWIDPTNDIVFVGMIQNLNGSRPDSGTPPTREISPRLTYAALTEPAQSP